MNIMRFKYFLEVAKTRSITTAAQNCYISQTAMSQQMDALEQELGGRLLVRSRTGTELTEAGLCMVAHAEQLLRQYEELLRDVKTHFADTGRLTVAYTGPLEQQLLTRAIPVFRKKHPEMEIRVRNYPMSDIANALLNGECDIALVIPHEVSLVKCERINVVTRPIYAAVSQDDPLAQNDHVTIGDLISRPIVLLKPEAGRRVNRTITDWLLQLGWSKEQILFADTIPNQLLMVNLGQGVSFMPLGRYISGVKLLPVADFHLLDHQTEAAMLRLTPLGKAFIQVLRQEAALDLSELTGSEEKPMR